MSAAAFSKSRAHGRGDRGICDLCGIDHRTLQLREALVHAVFGSLQVLFRHGLYHVDHLIEELDLAAISCVFEDAC
jgi:hypothetical protein